MLVRDFVTVKQDAGLCHVDFDDEAVANYFEDQVDAGRQPNQFARIWLHTHPGMVASPSRTDEDTFANVFGNCDWSVMFILGDQNKTYASLQIKATNSQMPLSVEIDYNTLFPGVDIDAWELEYDTNIRPAIVKFTPSTYTKSIPTSAKADDFGATGCDFGATAEAYGFSEAEYVTYDWSPEEWADALDSLPDPDKTEVMQEICSRASLWHGICEEEEDDEAAMEAQGDALLALAEAEEYDDDPKTTAETEAVDTDGMT